MFVTYFILQMTRGWRSMRTPVSITQPWGGSGSLTMRGRGNPVIQWSVINVTRKYYFPPGPAHVPAARARAAAGPVAARCLMVWTQTRHLAPGSPPEPQLTSMATVCDVWCVMCDVWCVMCEVRELGDSSGVGSGAREKDYFQTEFRERNLPSTLAFCHQKI